MKKLSKQSFEEIRIWMYRNARPLDLALWQYHFEDGSRESILKVLSNYQNNDGGFGNTLEPDSWNPNSSPNTTLYAIDLLNEINVTDKKNPIMQGIFKFLESGKHSDENGWLFSIQSNDDFPHAPWWTYDCEANEYESLGVSARIVSFLLKYADKDTQIYKRAFSVANKLIANLNHQSNYGDMGVGGYCTLKEIILQLNLTDKFDIELLSTNLKKLVYDSIERDTTKWAYYGKTPSSFISSPDSEFYKDNEEIMQKELDYIIENKPQNGVWGITWSWFDNNEIYPKEFAISENWWKANTAIGKLKLLRNFDRLD